MRELVKSLARIVASVVMVPRIVAFRIAAPIVGIDRALEGSTEAIARIPGIRGQYMRRAFLAGAGVRCHPTAAICYGTIFSKMGAEIDAHVYVGPNCHLGLVHLERDVLLAAGVHVPSGAHTHGHDEIGVPVREQRSEFRRGPHWRGQLDRQRRHRARRRWPQLRRRRGSRRDAAKSRTTASPPACPPG